MVGLPGVEHAVKRGLVIEIAVAAIDRQTGRRNCDQDGSGATLDHLVALAGRDQDHLMPEPCRGPQFGLGIGTNTAAGGRIKSADVGDPHRRQKTGRAGELQVKLCSSDANLLACADTLAQMRSVSSTGRLLLASIHDVSPRFESEVDRLLEMLDPHVGRRLAMLVVPNHWGDAPILHGSRFATRLRAWADEGIEMFLHGFFHRDDSRHAGALDRLKGRVMTAGEGEFLALTRAAASKRIGEGRALIEDVIGRPVDGFIAPAWLYSHGALEALSDASMPIAEDHMRVWSPKTGQQLARGPVITWASRTRLRLASSLVAASALRRAPMEVLRVGVHPPDVRHPAIVGSIGKTLAAARSTRRPAAYAELLRTS